LVRQSRPQARLLIRRRAVGENAKETGQTAAGDAAHKSSEVGGKVLEKGKELGQGTAEQTGLREKEEITKLAQLSIQSAFYESLLRSCSTSPLKPSSCCNKVKPALSAIGAS
jgi:hypothetical protein